MRRLLFTIIIVLFCSTTWAQKVSLSLQNVSLSEALKQIDKKQNTKRIQFVYDELEDFRVTKTIHNMPAIDAVHEVCGFYPMSVTMVGDDIFVECIQKESTKVIGRIVDMKSEPLPFANVTLLSTKDSTFINGGVANENGDFVIPCGWSKVLVRVSYIGFKTEYKVCDIGNIGTIRMKPDSYTLKEVKVKGVAPQYKMTRGGMTVNVEGTLLAKTGTAEDLLSQLPRVSVENGNVEVFAKGTPLIYINNQKMTDMKELQRLKSDEIKSVEVITNPGAEYSAEVESVIRIVTKRNEDHGFSISNHANAKYNGWLGGYEQLVVKYYTPKLEIQNNAWIMRSINGEDNNLNQHGILKGKDVRIEQHMDDHLASNCYMSEYASVSYAINDSNSVGASYNFDREPYAHIPNNGTQTIWSDGVREGEVTNSGTISWYKYSHTANVYYNGKLGAWNLNFDATYYTGRDLRRDISMEKSEELESRKVHSNSDQRNEMWAGKLVASQNVLGGALSVGTECTSTNSSGIFTNQENYIKPSETDIRENNISAFAEYSRQLNAFSLTAGVRYEHINRDYFSFGNRDDEISRKYSNFFPSISFSWNKNEWSAQLAYNQKTHRPGYQSLRDYMQYDNRYMYEGGNPQLQPETVHNIEASALWRWLSFSAGYKYTKDVMIWVESPLENQEVIYMTNRNFSNTQDFYASLLLSPKFGAYQPMLEIDYEHSLFKAKEYGAERSLNKPGLKLKIGNRIAFSDSFSGTLNFIAATRRYQGFRMINGLFHANASLRKSFLRDRWVVQLKAYDIFRSLQDRWTMYGLGVVATKDCYNYEQEFSLTVSYNFNQKRDKYKGRGAGNEERSRF